MPVQRRWPLLWWPWSLLSSSWPALWPWSSPLVIVLIVALAVAGWRRDHRCVGLVLAGANAVVVAGAGAVAVVVAMVVVVVIAAVLVAGPVAVVLALVVAVALILAVDGVS